MNHPATPAEQGVPVSARVASGKAVLLQACWPPTMHRFGGWLAGGPGDTAALAMAGNL